MVGVYVHNQVLIKNETSRGELNMKVKKKHLLQVGALIAICFLVMTPVFAERSSIYIETTKPSVSSNMEFTVLVNADSVSNLSAYQFDLVYSPKKYEIVDVEEGPLLNNNGTDSTFFMGPINGSRKDHITFANARIGDIGGVNGPGTLVKITFRAKRAFKNAKVKIVKKSIHLLDHNGQEIL